MSFQRRKAFWGTAAEDVAGDEMQMGIDIASGPHHTVWYVDFSKDWFRP